MNGGRGGGGAAQNPASRTLLLATSATPKRYSALLPRRAAADTGTRGPGLRGAGRGCRTLGASDSAQPHFQKELAQLLAPEHGSDSN